MDCIKWEKAYNNLSSMKHSLVVRQKGIHTLLSLEKAFLSII